MSFGSYMDSLSTCRQPDKVTGVPPLCFTGEKVQIPPLLSNAKRHHLRTPALNRCVRCVQVPGGAKALSQALCRSRVIPEPLHSCVHCDGVPGKANCCW